MQSISATINSDPSTEKTDQKRRLAPTTASAIATAANESLTSWSSLSNSAVPLSEQKTFQNQMEESKDSNGSKDSKAIKDTNSGLTNSGSSGSATALTSPSAPSSSISSYSLASFSSPSSSSSSSFSEKKNEEKLKGEEIKMQLAEYSQKIVSDEKMMEKKELVEGYIQKLTEEKEKLKKQLARETKANDTTDNTMILKLVTKAWLDLGLPDDFEKRLEQNVHATHKGWSLLHFCLDRYDSVKRPGKVRIKNLIDFLLKSGWDLYARDTYGRTPLYFLSNQELLEELKGKVVNCLISSQQDKTSLMFFTALLFMEKWSPYRRITPLHVLTSLPNKRVIGHIVMSGGLLVNRADQYGRLPLHCAAANRISDIVNIEALIISYPEGTGVADSFGMYPLSYAVMFGLEAPIDLLLEASDLDVLIKVQQQIGKEGYRIPESEQEEDDLFKEFKLDDPIYSIPSLSEEKESKFIKGRFRLEIYKKNKAIIGKKLQDKLQDDWGKQFLFTWNDEKYYADKQGKKHLRLSQKMAAMNTRERKEHKNWPSTFNADYCNNYQVKLTQVMKTWLSYTDKNKDESNPVIDFNMGEVVGWDNGEDTTMIQLYYCDASKSGHMRPVLPRRNALSITVVDEKEFKVEEKELTQQQSNKKKNGSKQERSEGFRLKQIAEEKGKGLSSCSSSSSLVTSISSTFYPSSTSSLTSTKNKDREEENKEHKESEKEKKKLFWKAEFTAIRKWKEEMNFSQNLVTVSAKSCCH